MKAPPWGGERGNPEHDTSKQAGDYTLPVEITRQCLCLVGNLCGPTHFILTLWYRDPAIVYPPSRRRYSGVGWYAAGGGVGLKQAAEGGKKRIKQRGNLRSQQGRVLLCRNQAVCPGG